MQQHLSHPVFTIIAETAEKTGQEVYVIGGFVRDLFLQRPSGDVDILVIGGGIDFARAVGERTGSKVTVFKNFGTAMLRYQELEIEFVGARKESYRSDSRKPIVENGTLEDDQKRRDFTINAMAIGLNGPRFGQLVDPFGGMEDLRNKIIRTPLNPDTTYSDDPLRMMRAIRFACQLVFRIDRPSLEAITRQRERIRIVSRERITDELNKIILSDRPSTGFRLLFDTGLLQLIFPQMAALQGVETIRGRSHKDNFYHTLEVLDNISRHTGDLWLRWAAILHDIAKPVTKRFDEKAGWTFHGHEDRGARMVPKIFRQMRLPQDEKMRFVQKMVALHLRPIVLAQDIVSDSAVRRLLFEAGDDIDSLMTLCNADITTKNEYKIKKYKRNFELVKQKLIDVEERDRIRNWQPPVSGHDIMELFNLKEGRQVGILKNRIREAILDGDIRNDKEEALRLLHELGAEMGLKTKD